MMIKILSTKFVDTDSTPQYNLVLYIRRKSFLGVNKKWLPDESMGICEREGALY
jgi:hypothetical protein